jgi:hypothetical protein
MEKLSPQVQVNRTPATRSPAHTARPPRPLAITRLQRALGNRGAGALIQRA